MTFHNIIDAAKTAEILGISKASIRNWVRHGYLKPLDEKIRFFELSAVNQLKKDIESGKINRLKSRANKSKARKSFIPTEYITGEENKKKIIEVVEYILNNKLSKKQAIFVLALNTFIQNGDIKKGSLEDITSFRADIFSRLNVLREFKDFFEEINGSGRIFDLTDKHLSYLLNCSLPAEADILGLIYQSIMNEGKKASLGSYFTPRELVVKMVRENINPHHKVLDPCCGTGQFLLAFADYIENPENIYGLDIDPNAVRIARLNLLLKYNQDFKPRVYLKDTLRDLSFNGNGLFASSLFSSDKEKIGEFDLIATNPPWGAEIEKPVLDKLRREFPGISSKESFSFFLAAGLSLLKEEGLMSFVLPEAILNVHTHQDIRRLLLKDCEIKKIECLGKRFKNVFSSVILMDLIKRKPRPGSIIKIMVQDREYTVKQERFAQNKRCVFDVHINRKDEKIIKKVYSFAHTTLKDQAEWALGIVTGDNRKYLSSSRLEGYEPVYKGTDVEKFRLKEPRSFIRFTPEKFQQVAPEEKYRAEEKLIYKFISSSLVFAYDNRKSLTLNSANILIPRIKGYPVKVILALFNTSLYQFVYMKKFNSIKILRGDLEQLPLPLWDRETFEAIVRMTDRILDGEEEFGQLDLYVMKKFGLTENEIEYIKSNVQ